MPPTSSSTPDGTFRYQHDGSFNPVDSFVYRIVDNDGESDTATVTIDITLLNEDAPDALDDELAVDEGAIATQLSDGQNSLLANDVGLTDGGIVVTVEVPPTHAADLVINDDGTFRYVHDGSENFVDSFVYRVADRDGEFDTATVSVTVRPISDAFPVAIGDEIEVTQGAMTTQLADGHLSLLDDDVNLRDLPIIASVETPPAHAASFVVYPDGTFRYEHDGTDSLSDSFVYRITDNDGEFDTATVTVTAKPITGAAPDAADDQLSVDHAGSTTVTQAGGDSLLANDVGLEDGPIVVALVSGPSHAAVFTLNPNGTFTYTHDGGSALSDSLVYRLTDSHGDSDEAVVSITIGPQSLTTPDALDDNASVEEGGTTTALNEGSASVLANDSGLLDLPINVVLETGPVHAFAFVLNPDGTFRYEHDGTENFRDSFVYRIIDNDGETDIATVEIAISPVSDAEPNAADDSIVVAEGGVATELVSGVASVLLNDSGLDDAPITVSLESEPSYANSFDFHPDGTFAYQHDGSENFADSFTYTLTDNDGQASTATVSIQITSVSDADPVAAADSITVSEGQTATVLDGGATSVLDNDSGLDDAPIIIEVTSKPLHASAFDLQPDGSFTYEHDGTENFVDAFDYLIRDNDGQSATATVTVNIERVSDTEPIAADDNLTVLEGGVATLLDGGADNLLANDAGLDDGPMLIVLETPPSYVASFAVNADGTFRYEHDGSENFADFFVYRITDNDGESATATVSISVTAVSDTTPSANEDAIRVSQGGVAAVLLSGEASLLANDTGLEDTPVVAALDTPPTHATAFELKDDGTFRYEHDGSENLSDSFVYSIVDNDGQTSTATVTIDVVPSDDDTEPPSANASADDVILGGMDAQRIVVQYTDNVGIQVTDLDDTDVYVVTPAGQEIPAAFVAVGDTDAAIAVLAAYEIPAPSDGWSPSQNGIYRILMRENEVRDAAGNAVPGGEIGQFNIQIPNPPIVLSVQRNDGREDFSRLSSLAFQFNAEVTVQPGAFRLINASSDQTIDTSSAEFTYDAASRVASWGLRDISLDIGTYRVVLDASQVLGIGGTLLDGNGDGEPGGDYEPDRRFPVTWAGDADLDLDVDFTDFVALAENFGKETDSLWSEGDFDGDRDCRLHRLRFPGREFCQIA